MNNMMSNTHMHRSFGSVYNTRNRMDNETEVHYLQRIFEKETFEENQHKLSIRIKSLELRNEFDMQKMVSLPDDIVIHQVFEFLGTEFFGLIRKSVIIENHSSRLIRELRLIPSATLYNMNNKYKFVTINSSYLWYDRKDPIGFLKEMITFLSNETKKIHWKDTNVDNLEFRENTENSNRYGKPDIYKAFCEISTYIKLPQIIKQKINNNNVIGLDLSKIMYNGIEHLIDKYDIVYNATTLNPLGVRDTWGNNGYFPF